MRDRHCNRLMGFVFIERLKYADKYAIPTSRRLPSSKDLRDSGGHGVLGLASGGTWEHSRGS